MADDLRAALRERTAEIDYTGDGDMTAWFNDVVEVFERHGLKIEGSSDGPTEDGWYARCMVAEAERDAARADLVALLEGMEQVGWRKVHQTDDGPVDDLCPMSKYRTDYLGAGYVPVYRLSPSATSLHAGLTGAVTEPLSSRGTTRKRIPMSDRSYHDLHITTASIERASIFNLPYGFEVRCTRVTGWELYDSGARMSPHIAQPEPSVLAGEYEGPDKWLVLDVAGDIIVDSRRAAGESTDG